MHCTCGFESLEERHWWHLGNDHYAQVRPLTHFQKNEVRTEGIKITRPLEMVGTQATRWSNSNGTQCKIRNLRPYAYWIDTVYLRTIALHWLHGDSVSLKCSCHARTSQHEIQQLVIVLPHFRGITSPISQCQFYLLKISMLFQLFQKHKKTYV